jgi:hypothetical protein
VWRPIREKLEELNVADKFQERTFLPRDNQDENSASNRMRIAVWL